MSNLDESWLDLWRSYRAPGAAATSSTRSPSAPRSSAWPVCSAHAIAAGNGGTASESQPDALTRHRQRLEGIDACVILLRRARRLFIR